MAKRRKQGALTLPSPIGRGFSRILVALALAAFCTHARAQRFTPDDLPLESGETSGLRQPEPLPELPADSPADAPERQADDPPEEATDEPQPVLLPPVDSKRAEELTLSEAQVLADAYHPALREAMGRVRAAQGNWLQVGLRPNPEIGYVGEEMGDDGTAGKQGGFVSKEFVTAGKLRLNRAVASREVAAAEQRTEFTRLQVLTTVRIYYFEMLAAERAVELATQLKDIAADAVRNSEERLKALDIPRVTLLQSQVESEATALLEVQATERRDAAWRRLSSAIGISDPKPVKLDDAINQPLPELSWDVLRERLLSESPELSELRFDVDRARYRVQRECAGRVPNVNVMTGVQLDNVTHDTIANVEVSVPLPVFDRNQGAVAEARGELAAAQAALQQREIALEDRLANAMRDYETARRRVVKYSTEVLPAAAETLRIMNAGYKDRELEYLQVLSVQQMYTQQNLSYLEDLETAWKKWAEIDGLLVGPLPERDE
jgi:cobalt-zinc-cadmium efflux system outer membrane protein